MRAIWRVRAVIVLTAAALVVAGSVSVSVASTDLITQDLASGLSPTDLANALVGEGVSVSNVTYTGAQVAAGAFTGGTEVIGFRDGVVLSTGNIADVRGPNETTDTSTEHGTAGDSDLNGLTGGFQTFDAAVLEFDFVPSGDTIRIDYVFASEEYNEFVGSEFNDVFGFFVNGQNCATVSGDPVSINTINGGDDFGGPATNPGLYLDNDFQDGSAPHNTEMDGLTVVLTCEASVNPGQANRMKLAVADTSDGIYDANVFLGTGAFAARPDPLPPGGFDGDPATSTRVNTPEAIIAAEVLSQARFADAGASPSAYHSAGNADYVVLGRDDVFADSLAGSPLSANGPLLFTKTTAVSQSTLQEVRRVLPQGGRVYLLGGTQAINTSVENQLRTEGFEVRRLSGPTRVETALAVADEVRQLFPSQTLASVARAFGPADNPTAAWADSVTGGAWAASEGVPILITQTESMHPAVQAWLDANSPSETVLFGGTAALSDAVAAGAPNPRRVAGAERSETASRIATDLWGVTGEGTRRFVVINGFHEDGWQFGLSSGGLSADSRAPMLMVQLDSVPGPTAGLASTCGSPAVDTLLAGSESLIGAPAAAALDDLDGQAC